MYKLQLTAKAKKELKNLQKSYKIVVALIFEELKEDPFLGKPLGRELIKRFSFRVGVYRIIYIVNKKDKIITVISAGHRSKIYD